MDVGGGMPEAHAACARVSVPAIALAALIASAPGAAAAADDADAAERLWGRGRLDLRYVFRSADATQAAPSATDHDLFEDLFVEGGRGDGLRLEASGRLHEELNGIRPVNSPLFDIYDTYHRTAQGWLYTGYFEGLDLGPFERARLGRQYYANDVEVRFDGALLESAPVGGAVKLTAYGGIPVHLYEASRRDDWIVGAAAELVAIPRADVRFDYVYDQDFRPDLEEQEQKDGIPRTITRRDNLYQLAATFRATEEVRLRALASTFAGNSSRFTLEALIAAAGIDLTSHLRYTLQLGAYRDLAIDFSPLDDVLGEYEPYHDIYGDVRKGLGKHVAVEVGVEIRRLADSGVAGPYNHEFERFFVLLPITEWPWAGLSLSPLGELYVSEQGHHIFQASFDAAQKVGPVTLGAGTTYALYEFDEFFLQERDHVRTVFGSVEWRATGWLTLRASYSFQEDDVETYNVVRVDARISF
jgi:hypothetical protein